MKRYDNLNEHSETCWVINIKIPDNAVIAEVINYIHQQVSMTLQKQDISEAHREFLKRSFHVATTKDTVHTAITNAKKRRECPCVVMAFNATLSQAEYNKLGAIGFTYISWTEKAWAKAKNDITSANLIKLLKCLGRNLVDVGCQALIETLFKSIL